MTEFLTRIFVKNYKDIKNLRVRAAYGIFSGVVGIFCNLLLFGAKIVIGLLSGSVSITADAVNNLSDASSSIVSLIGFRLAGRPADERHPYGHGRYEYLSAIFVAVLVLMIGGQLLESSVKQIIHPEPVEFSFPLLLILVLSIGIKSWMGTFFRSLGEKLHSNTLLASAADSRGDVLSTGAVLAGVLISEGSDWQLDGWIGLVVAGIILFNGIILIKDTLNPLLGTAPEPEEIQKICDKLRSYPGVLGVHDLMIHDYGPCRKFASVHLEMAGEADVFETHDIIDGIERDFLKEGLHLIAHFDPILTKLPPEQNLRKQVFNVVRSIDPRLSIHDLQPELCKKQTKLIFDCIAPPEVGLSDEELKLEIEKRVCQLNDKYCCEVHIDHSVAPIPQ